MSDPKETGTPPETTPALKENDPKRIEADVIGTLKTCYDPEIPVDIYELGLIYAVKVSDECHVDIQMTLTSPMCPVAGTLPPEVEQKVRGLAPALPGTGLSSPRASRATPPASPDLAPAQVSSISAAPGQDIATYAICRPGLTVSLDCVIRPLERPAQLVWAQAGMRAPSDPDRAASLHLAAGNSLYADAPE